MDLELAEPVEVPTGYKPARAVSSDLILAKLRLLWGERRLLYRVSALGTIFALAAALLIPSEFESTTRLMPPDNQSTASMAMLASMTAKTGTGLGAVAGDLLGLKSSGDLFIGVLQSRTLQDRLVDRFHLRKVYRERLGEGARRKLMENTVIYEDRKSGIITIAVKDKNPVQAAAIAQAYVDELNQLVSELSTSGAHRERVFLEERLKSVQQDLETAETDFSQFSSKNMAIDIKEQGKAMVEAVATLQGQLIAAESELEGLRQIYADGHVRVRAVQARISELKQQLEKVGGKGEDKLADSTSSGDALYPSIKKLPLLGVTYADMYRRTKVQEAVYEALTQQFELAKVQEVKETPSVKLLDVADIPEKKSFPPRTLITLLGLLFSFLFGMAWILSRAHWQEMDSRHPAKVLAQGVFGGARSHLEQASRNGSRLGWMVRRAHLFRSASEAHEVKKNGAFRQEDN